HRAARGAHLSVKRFRLRAEAWCVAGAVALRLGAIWLASRSATPWIDPDGYLDRANALLRGVPWVHALGGQDGQIVPPLYTASLAFAVRVGFGPATILLMQAALGGVACALIIALSKHVSERTGALIAGWGFALSPAWISAAPAFWSEHLHVPIVALALLLLVSSLRARQTVRWIAAGAASAAAALTR